MAGTTYDIKVNANQATQALENLQKKVEATNDRFDQLRNAITGLALGGFVTSAIQYAAAIDDVATASGMAVANVVGFGKAVAANGGSVEGASTAIARFNNFIQDAADGNKAAQDSFLKLGVSLNDLATLSEQDLLRKTVEGLAKTRDNALRTSASMAIFGKSFATVDLKGVNEQLDKQIEKAQKLAPAIKAAAEAEDKFNAAVGELKGQVLIAIQPLTEFLTKIDSKQIQVFASTLIKLGEAFLAITIATKIAAALEAMALAMRAASVSAAGLTLSMRAAAGSTFANFLLGLRGITQAFNLKSASIVKSYTGIGIFSQTLKSLGTGLLRMIPFIGQAVAAFLVLDGVIEMITGSSIVDWAQRAAKALGLISETSKERKKREDEAEAARKAADDARRKSEQNQIDNKREIVDATRKEKEALDKIYATYQTQNAAIRDRIKLETELVGAGEEQRRFETEREDAYRRYISTYDQLKTKLQEVNERGSGVEQQTLTKKIIGDIKKLGEEYNKEASALRTLNEERVKKERLQRLEQYGLESLIDSNRRVRDIQEEIANVGLTEIERRYKGVDKAAQDSAIVAINAEEQRRKAVGRTDWKLSAKEIDAYYQASAAGIEREKSALPELLKALQQESDLRFTISQNIRARQELVAAGDQLTKMNLTEIEQKYYDIDAAARNLAENRIDAIDQELIKSKELAEGQSIRTLDPERVRRIYSEAAKGTAELKNLNKQIYDQSRTFSYGWKTAFQEYAKNATNAAQTAQRIFTKTFQGIEDLIVDFVKTGKFNFKEFFADIGEELLRSQVRSLLAQLGDSLGVGSLFGGGGIQAGQGSTQTNPLFVSVVNGGMGGAGGMMNSFGGIPGVGGNGMFDSGGSPLISGGGIGGGITNAIGGISSAFSSVGKIWDTVKNVGTTVYDTISNIGSGISDFFGGFFANGGMLPAGKFGVVGERGPELISGPASITPMNGGGNVTYNINAVDAMSFKQMIARDPAFIHAVASQGARSTPGRY